ncbi:PREDICTED: gamma-glutamyltranspeptidase 1-like [Priapulus caudatus]|uniref:Gamma-glutamyltranspeptidase 1-like n=1 Tax=Priapulus caudatus TaxID=37621 RepID=A0ABM1ECJ3_PRICU|nr:PREDICTED: gamma-glutamyltranspeptidase 1-like [Priapulus caudatus]
MPDGERVVFRRFCTLWEGTPEASSGHWHCPEFSGADGLPAPELVHHMGVEHLERAVRWAQYVRWAQPHAQVVEIAALGELRRRAEAMQSLLDPRDKSPQNCHYLLKFSIDRERYFYRDTISRGLPFKAKESLLPMRQTCPRRTPTRYFKVSGRANRCYTLLKGDLEVVVAKGGLAIAVPSEIIGYATAHDKFGKLPWKDLFVRVISLCRSGFPVRAALADAIGEIPEEGVIREMFTNPKTGKLYQEGEVMTRDKLANTFEVIANDSDKYKELAETMVEEIKEQGGIIELEDLTDYTVETPEPLQVEIDGMTMFSPPPPASGAVLSLILNILEGYRLTPNSFQDFRLDTLHLIAEAFKHGYSKRSALGDPNFIDNIELIANMTADDYAEAIRSKIWYNTTHDVDWYEPTSFNYTSNDAGTSHVSVYANGDAVSVTSTINTHFGSKVAGRLSGIIYNNEIMDFFNNKTGKASSPANFILPGKRPMSSMCPMILVDRSGQVRLVIGASGGAKITSSTAWLKCQAPNGIIVGYRSDPDPNQHARIA